MNTTMNDIARASGASVSTVARVIHNSGYVSEEVRKKVEKAIDELGYVPNHSARALKSQKSGIIGSLVVQNTNGLYYRINDSIMRAARRSGYQVLTMESQRDAGSEAGIIENFISLRVEGLAIVSDTSITPEMFARLKAADIPVVAVERGYLNQGIDSLIVQDFEACRDAVRRMANLGHKRIALVACRVFDSVENERCQGYLAGLQEAGISPEEQLIHLLPGYDTQYGRIAAEQLLSLETPPTAVLATADSLAAGALQAAYARRVRIPEDLSIVGYDDVLSQSLSPAINSIGLFLGEIGNDVMDLISLRQAEPDRPAEQRPIETVYADRGSVRNLTKKQETIITF